MSAYLKAEDRYCNDPRYRTIVDVLTHALLQLELTPTEMREMAVYACIRFEHHRLRPTVIPANVANEIRGNIDQLTRWLDHLVPALDRALVDGVVTGKGSLRVPARLDPEGTAVPKTHLAAPIEAGREGTMYPGNASIHVDDETGERTKLQ